MERLMLLDGNGLIYRGYFALPPLSTSKGELVNAVLDRKSTRLNSSHIQKSRMPSSA